MLEAADEHPPAGLWIDGHAVSHDAFKMPSPSQTSEPGPQVDYAPPPPASRRAKLQRPLILVVILIAAFFCRDWPSDIWDHFRLLYLYHKCVLHPVSGGSIAYATGTPPTSISSTQWGAFETAADPSRPPSASPIVFLGERETMDGDPRLVMITAHVNWTAGAGYSYVGFETRSARLTTLEPLEENFQGAGGIGVSTDPRVKPISPDIVINSAIADSVDLSHVTFSCRLYQTTYTVDAYLKDDGRLLITGMIPSQPTSGPAPVGWSVRSFKQ